MGVLTIVQAPRTDVIPPMKGMLPGVEIVEAGVLDDLQEGRSRLLRLIRGTTFSSPVFEISDTWWPALPRGNAWAWWCRNRGDRRHGLQECPQATGGDRVGTPASWP